MDSKYNWWLDPYIPFERKAEQNLFWRIYEENKRLLARVKHNGPNTKLKSLLASMRAFARENNWNRAEWYEFTGKQWIKNTYNK